VARADLLIDIIRAGAEGRQKLFSRALEALISEERSKQHRVLANGHAAHLQLNSHHKHALPVAPVYLNGSTRFPPELQPQRHLTDLILPADIRQASAPTTSNPATCCW
jgi:hypothetical protein